MTGGIIGTRFVLQITLFPRQSLGKRGLFCPQAKNLAAECGDDHALTAHGRGVGDWTTQVDAGLLGATGRSNGGGCFGVADNVVGYPRFMPVEFLSEAEPAAYRRYAATVARPVLDRRSASTTRIWCWDGLPPRDPWP